MMKFSVTAVARHQMDAARLASSGRSASTVYGGHEHVLRQTVIALAAGRTLNEHLNPGEATLLVLTGRIRLVSGEEKWEARMGDLLVIPSGSSAVHAMEDSTMLLTVAKVRGGAQDAIGG